MGYYPKKGEKAIKTRVPPFSTRVNIKPNHEPTEPTPSTTPHYA